MACSDDNEPDAATEKPDETLVGDAQLNKKVDTYLKEMYLWNDEYKTLTLDFTQNYEDFFYGALGSMKTNTLDKRPSKDGYRLFSYIEKRTILNSRSTNYIKKESRYDFGIAGMIVVYSGQDAYLMIRGVYPESPAALADIKRGTIIAAVNGQKITASNVVSLYYALYIPTSIQTMELTDMEDKKTTITSKALFPNPVIMKQVKEIDGHKIGYLVYSEFNAGFDDELFEAFKYFKSENITDLILDLRYNGGGYNISANLIASCIVGSASQGKVFAQYRYNEERMKALNNKRSEELFSYSDYGNLGTSLEAGGLDLTRVYCLTGSSTASASELVINSLRGVNVEVILIGEKTTGKNVGMEYEDITTDKDTYRVVPISFQSYNAKGFGDYSAGFEPDLVIDEIHPINGDANIYVYQEYGTDKEYLYAAAIKRITGKEFMANTRSATSFLKGKAQSLPQISKPGQDGMIKAHKN